jgi:hypothetical protein
MEARMELPGLRLAALADTLEQAAGTRSVKASGEIAGR